MSHSIGEEELETYRSFLDQLQELRNSLSVARDAAEISLPLAKQELGKMLRRIEYTLQEY